MDAAGDLSWSMPIPSSLSSTFKSKKTVKERVDDLVYPFLFQMYLVALAILFRLIEFSLSLLWLVLLLQKSIYKVESKKRLVIIGGGYAGTVAAMTLEHRFDVTLIDTKNYFEFTPSRLRTIAEPQHTDKIQIKYKKFLSETRIVKDYVTSISSQVVITEYSRIPFDYLIICSGSRYGDTKLPPIDKSKVIVNDFTLLSEIGVLGDTAPGVAMVVSARVQHMEKYNPMVEKSQRILIIGGGTVGVELAAEVIERYPNKEVIIVHSNEKLMNRSPLRAICYTEEYFRKKGVTLLLNDKVVGHEGRRFQTRNGMLIEADLAFLCTGNVPNSEFLKNSSYSNCINTFGFVSVNEHLQMKGEPNIFVAGDITDIPEEEEKLCQTAAAQIAVAIKNIQNMEKNKDLVIYSPKKCPMVISLGKYDGLFMYSGWTLTGFVPAAMKEFIEWKEMVHYNYPRWMKPKKEKSVTTII